MQARSILPDGMVQEHTFHRYADEDWVVFEAIEGVPYRIEAQIPANSPADVSLEIYDSCANTPSMGKTMPCAWGDPGIHIPQ